MRKLSLVFILFAVATLSLKSQKLTYVGFEGGAKWDHYKLTDYGDGLLYKPTIGFKIGFTVGHEVMPNMFVETGFAYNQLLESIRYKVMPYAYGTGTENLLFEMPIRFKYRYPLVNDKFSITGSLGLTVAYNESYSWQGTSEGGAIGLISTDSVFCSEISTYTGKKVLPFFEAGLSLDYKFKNNLMISLVNNYSLGLNTIYSKELLYRINDGAEQEAENISKGSQYNVMLSVKVPISNIWDKSEENILRKKNLQEGLEKNKEKRFYISADAGICKPYFTEDNPNIKGTDITNIFWTNNTFLGINFGAKFYKNWIVEAGFYGNEFMNQHYIYEDGIPVSGGGFSGSDERYLTIPLKVKYEYNFLNNRMSLMPSVGTAVLFSDDEGMYSFSTSSGYETVDGVVTNNIEEFAYAYRENGATMIITAGLGFEFALTNNIILMLNSSYGKGFKDFNRLNIDYNSDLFNEQGNIFFQGTNFNLSAGVKVPLGFKRKEK